MCRHEFELLNSFKNKTFKNLKFLIHFLRKTYFRQHFKIQAIYTELLWIGISCCVSFSILRGIHEISKTSPFKTKTIICWLCFSPMLPVRFQLEHFVFLGHLTRTIWRRTDIQGVEIRLDLIENVCCRHKLRLKSHNFSMYSKRNC